MLNKLMAHDDWTARQAAEVLEALLQDELASDGYAQETAQDWLESQGFIGTWAKEVAYILFHMNELSYPDDPFCRPILMDTLKQLTGE